MKRSRGWRWATVTVPAVLARDGHRCRDCGERSAVTVPAGWAEVERLCRNRPPKHRNWTQDEPIANLIAENIVHHVEGAVGPYEPKVYG